MVTGGSYGGHIDFCSCDAYSDRIRASLPVVGISNLVPLLERTSRTVATCAGLSMGMSANQDARVHASHSRL